MAYAYKKIPGAPNDDYGNCFAYAYSSWIDFEGAPTPPSVTTTIGVTNITRDGAKLGGKVTSTNGAAVTATGFVYTTTSGVYTSAVNVAAAPLTINAPNTAFEATISTGLAAGQVYYFKAYATNQVGTEYGSEQSFMTLPDVSALLYPPALPGRLRTFTHENFIESTISAVLSGELSSRTTTLKFCSA